ncbi:MAG: sulfite exporter TauE/SafE family protein, partial [Bradymonadaceae bacterium]
MPDMVTYPLVFLAAMVAGIMNVLAGSGSLLTLPALVFLGLPSPVANGTNRVGIIVQCLVGVETYRRGGKLEWTQTGWFIGPTLVGAGLGAWIATQ